MAEPKSLEVADRVHSNVKPSCKRQSVRPPAAQVGGQEGRGGRGGREARQMDDGDGSGESSTSVELRTRTSHSPPLSSLHQLDYPSFFLRFICWAQHLECFMHIYASYSTAAHTFHTHEKPNRKEEQYLLSFTSSPHVVSWFLVHTLLCGAWLHNSLNHWRHQVIQSLKVFSPEQQHMTRGATYAA